MEAQRIIVLLLMFVAHHSGAIEICEEGLRTRVQNGTVGEDGSLQAEDGTVYPNGTFWQEDHFHWACPCLSGPCVRICALTPTYIEDFYFIADHFEKNLDNATLYFNDTSNFKTEVWENDITSKKVALKSLFKLVHLENETKECSALGLQEEINLNTQLFKDGSLRFFPFNVTTKMIHEPDQFCLFPIEWDNFRLAIICVEEYKTTIYSWLYPAFITISLFFLVLTLIAQCLVKKDFKSLHVKLLLHHCVSLIFSYLVYLILVATGGFADNTFCCLLALLSYYFNMVACFWLNVMCYEIYSTFKCGYGKHNLKIKYLALYAWGCPMVFTLFAIWMQDSLPLDHFLNPKIGYAKCWFSEKLQDFIYYQGPKMVLFVSNIVLFVMTTIVLRRLRRESSAALSSNDSRVHQDDKKSRFSMYLKLFLLMGCTWILEFVSFLFDDLHYIWIYTDAINYLRGVLVFWVTVISNASVRKLVQDKISKFLCSNC